MARLALAFSAGAAWGLVGASWVWAPLLAAVLLALPNATSRGPGPNVLWIVVGLSGWVAGSLADPAQGCGAVSVDEPAVLVGRFLGTPADGSGSFAPEGCASEVRVVLADSVPAGRRVRIEGRWRQGRARPWFAAAEVTPFDGASDDGRMRWRIVRWRDGLVRRIRRLYGERAPLVAALTLARAEGVDPGLREAFARAGLAHLLAISGFHVGVIAVGVFTLLRGLGGTSRRSEVGATAATWAYVAAIGFPDPALRAAIMLTLVASSRAMGRPTARWGPFASAWLVLVLMDPVRLASVGFQLSFAGVAGLIAWSGPLASWIRRRGRRRVPRSLATALAAGVAATLATLPIVAWHFERVSIIGIPATLVATPIVALALVGALASLALDFVSHGLAMFLAGGVDVLLAMLEVGTETVAAWSVASVWTTKPTVVAGTLGLALATFAARRPRVGSRARRVLSVSYVACGVLAWPVLLGWQGRGTVELVVIDVGQGDAIALRGPTGRWMLVDAGPPVRDSDLGGHPAVRALRARGVRRLDALVLTHPDLDHIGGVLPILSQLEVDAIYDPGVPAPKVEFLAVLDEAARRGVPWLAARSGGRITFDGWVIDILHPPQTLPEGVEANETSVVLKASYGAFDAILTGDAYKDVERALLPSLGPVEVLKVGHHGSDTSTDSAFLDRTHPETALISVGRGNRYGHPAPEVMARLRGAGAQVRRTDLEGTLEIRARRDGSYVIRATRGR